MEIFTQSLGVKESCGAVSKREDDIPGLTQYRDRISAIFGSLVNFYNPLHFDQDKPIHNLLLLMISK